MRRTCKTALDFEPLIADMIEDPVVRAMMSSDRVDQRDLLDLVVAVKARREAAGLHSDRRGCGA
jgi:hypothetical protein